MTIYNERTEEYTFPEDIPKNENEKETRLREILHDSNVILIAG